MNEEEIANKAKELLKSFNEKQVSKLVSAVLHDEIVIADLIQLLDFQIK